MRWYRHLKGLTNQEKEVFGRLQGKQEKIRKEAMMSTQRILQTSGSISDSHFLEAHKEMLGMGESMLPQSRSNPTFWVIMIPASFQSLVWRREESDYPPSVQP